MSRCAFEKPFRIRAHLEHGLGDVETTQKRTSMRTPESHAGFATSTRHIGAQLVETARESGLALAYMSSRGWNRTACRVPHGESVRNWSLKEFQGQDDFLGSVMLKLGASLWEQTAGATPNYIVDPAI